MHAIERGKGRCYLRHGAFFFQVFFIGYRHAGDGNFQWHNRVDGLGERQLHRAAHLSAVDFGSHHGAEGADIEEVFAHPRDDVAGFGFVFLAVFLLPIQCQVLHKRVCFAGLTRFFLLT